MIAGDYNTSLSVIDRTSCQKISKDLKELNNITEWDNWHLLTTCLISAECTLFSSTYGTGPRQSILLAIWQAIQTKRIKAIKGNFMTIIELIL